MLGSHNSSKLIGICNTIFIMPFNKISKRLFTFTSMDVTSVVYMTKRFNTNYRSILIREKEVTIFILPTLTDTSVGTKY